MKLNKRIQLHSWQESDTPLGRAREMSYQPASVRPTWQIQEMLKTEDTNAKVQSRELIANTLAFTFSYVPRARNSRRPKGKPADTMPPHFLLHSSQTRRL